MATFNASPGCGCLNPLDISSDDFTMDRAIHLSEDGRHASQHAINFTTKRRCLDPSELQDAYGEWVPVPETSEPLGDAPPYGNNEGGEGEVRRSMLLLGTKRKWYLSSDDPHAVWRKMKQMFLDETLRGEGLGDFLGDPHCSCCPAQRDEAAETTAPVSQQLFRCADCGIFLQCLACVISRHAFQPMHVLKEWTGRFWEDVMLCSLGLVYQVGHGGLPCITPVNPAHTMVVIHTNGIHTTTPTTSSSYSRNNWYPATTVDPATCATFKSLELYRLLNVDRYKAFGRMTRQYAFLKRAKCAGCGHNILGLNGTVNGGYAVLCWTCPQDGINLPEGWRDVAREFSRRELPAEKLNTQKRGGRPVLCLCGTVAEGHPDDHGFALLWDRGVVCARHELVRLQGIGDLQKSER
ncbi:hypothetical protein DFH09DRAFT_1084149 [Mycena vulgaris]|nr:hypothetical protein DFH09DRAFT_1104042 [Mycena vulgaris]KAJ6558637.1 hypothetical protein DFH09DRAFT_1084149 [Mycena vulgaris]